MKVHTYKCDVTTDSCQAEIVIKERPCPNRRRGLTYLGQPVIDYHPIIECPLCRAYARRVSTTEQDGT